jgi:hypothetical protein
LGLLLAALLGCEKDEIRHYQATRLEIPPDAAPAAPTPTRMITAIFPHKDRTWFFKLTGAPEEVERHKEEFEHFIQSVRFTKKGDPPITYTVPQGWQRGQGDALRFATFRFGSKEKPLEVSITPLGREAGSLLDNVNRWRKQLELKPIDEAELSKEIREINVDEIKVTMVDLTGMMAVKGPMNAPFAKGHPPIRDREQPVREREPGRNEPAATLPLTYRTPPGWKEQQARDGISLAAFQVGDGDRKAVVTISAAGGSLSANVNRWRAQVGLEPVSEDQIRKDLRPMNVDGLPGNYADLSGPESAGGSRILAVMVPRSDMTWFFKMRGPADLVGREKAAFEAFMGSVRFAAEEGGKR